MTDKNDVWFRKLKGVKFIKGDKVVCINRDAPCDPGDIATVVCVEGDGVFPEGAYAISGPGMEVNCNKNGYNDPQPMYQSRWKLA